jgi:hypothetical protein
MCIVVLAGLLLGIALGFDEDTPRVSTGKGLAASETTTESKSFAASAKETEAPKPKPKPKAKPSTVDAVDAWVMAQDFVTSALRSPSTADFGSAGWFGGGEYQKPSESALNLGDGTWVVNGWVDAQNAFGATIRETWVIEMRYLGNNRWRRVGLVVGNPQTAADIAWLDGLSARLKR